MIPGNGSRGATLVELLVSMTVLSLLMTGLAGMLIENTRVSKVEQMTVEAQANARNCLTIVTAKLRSTGWDPLNVGLPLVALDPDLSDNVSQIEVFVDMNEDGETDGSVTDDDIGEQLLIRHVQNRVEWRQSADTSVPFEVLARNITNDANGDGIPEPMFVPDSVTDPTMIRVRITAESPEPDSRTGEPVRYTLVADVHLRKSI